MDGPEILIPIFICAILFIGLPWLIFHYITQWKKNGTLPVEDEKLLDELHDLARRLTDRLDTIERIVAADNPSYRPGINTDRRDYTPAGLPDRRDERLEDDLDRIARSRFERR